MTETTPPRDEPHTSLEAVEGSEAGTVARLRAGRPEPTPEFRTGLRHRLGSDPPRRQTATTRGRVSNRASILGFAGAGAVLLIVAALGLAGAGPFGA